MKLLSQTSTRRRNTGDISYGVLVIDPFHIIRHYLERTISAKDCPVFVEPYNTMALLSLFQHKLFKSQMLFISVPVILLCSALACNLGLLEYM